MLNKGIMGLTNERVIREERMHAGIFALPAVAAVSLLVLLLPVWILLHSMTSRVPGAGLGWVPMVVFFPLVVVVVPSLLVTLFAYLKSQITLTDKRLLYRTGLVARISGEVPLENVDAIFIVEPVLGRLLGYGAVMVTTVGGAKFPIGYIGKPQVFHGLLQNAVANSKYPTPPPKQRPPEDDSRYMPKS